jgi:GNAT superfamily N-acetyltransferase
VRYALREEPALVEHCHCSMCRKWHGAAFSTLAEVKTASLEWRSGEEELATYRSSPERDRTFCRRCGSKLFIRRLDTPDTIALCLATLDDAPAARPRRHVFDGDRVTWLPRSDSLPRYDLYPGWDTVLRPTGDADLDFVLALERDPANTPYIGQWSREQHQAAIRASDREHWLIARRRDGSPLGFLLAFDLRADGLGVYVKRIAVTEKSRGFGREALARFALRAFGELHASHLWLSVRDRNERAQRVYRDLGFERIEVTPGEREKLSALVGGFSATSAIMRLEPGRLRLE